MTTAKTTPTAAAVRKAREKRGFDRARLASEAGVRERTIERIESGTHPPSLDTIAAIADALGVTVDALLGRSSGRRASA